MKDFFEIIESSSNFELRRLTERLREGLFDPLGVRLLTATESLIGREFDRGVKALAGNSHAHLCICGAYGQGKSHSLTYTRQRALRQGFVTSQINLDPRETPLHLLHEVYRALVNNISFPNNETSLVKQWERYVKQLSDQAKEEGSQALLNLPEEIPHLFKAVLAGFAQNTISLSDREKRLKKHADFRPYEFSHLLSRALLGEALPSHRLRTVFKYRQVSFYKEASLTCRGWEPYLGLIRGLARLFKQMGFKGWVLLFDEGESVAQARINSRSKSYEILHQMIFPELPVPGLYPVFAFTDDFFLQVRQEDYDLVSVRGGIESPYFERDYASAWDGLNVCRLHDLTPMEWKDLSKKLIEIHTRAYGWQPLEPKIRRRMARRLTETRTQEARLKFKALVDQLDLIHQGQVLSLEESIPGS
ncbi:DUF2791 family P-loop domain-containing protein [Desulfococcaceae bacterium HSG8]|nr:DUF2791 family P-loop domain-containing protein [Desulfococcaceae bacterium HSG8]